MSTTAPPTPGPVSVTTVSTYVNKVVDVLLGELLANPRVTKLISWVMVGLGALGHKYLGLDPTETAALIASGGAGHFASSVKENTTTPRTSVPPSEGGLK
jgi:hypothetical protein